VESELYSTEGALLEEYPDYIQLARDLPMHERSYREGMLSDERGEGSVDVLLRPLAEGWTRIDIVTTEPRPHPFTEYVLDCASAVLFDRYRRKVLPDSRVHGLYAVTVPMDPEWMGQAVRVCMAKRWPELPPAEETRLDEAPGGTELRWALRAEPEAVFFCGTRAEAPAECLVGVRFSRRAGRQRREEARAALREAVAMWHAVSFKTSVSYTCPPGTPVLRNGRVEFEGVGGAYRRR
jgi:hypothetical protein